jgi:hypothetical protein
MDGTLEDGGGVGVVLEDGGGTAALGGGIGLRLKIAAEALGGGCGRRTYKDGIGISVIKAEGYCYYIGISVGKDGKRGRVRCEECMLATMARRWEYCGGRWQRWRYGYNNSVNEARARGQWRRTSTGKARAMRQWRHNRIDKGEGKRLPYRPGFKNHRGLRTRH